MDTKWPKIDTKWLEIDTKTLKMYQKLTTVYLGHFQINSLQPFSCSFQPALETFYGPIFHEFPRIEL